MRAEINARTITKLQKKYNRKRNYQQTTEVEWFQRPYFIQYGWFLCLCAYACGNSHDNFIIEFHTKKKRRNNKIGWGGSCLELLFILSHKFHSRHRELVLRIFDFKLIENYKTENFYNKKNFSIWWYYNRPLTMLQQSSFSRKKERKKSIAIKKNLKTKNSALNNVV